MESGINADQNFYSRRLLSQSPDRGQQPQQLYDSATVPDPNLRSPVVPPKLPFLTTANLQAATTNGFGGDLSGIDNPDDFYRDYRGVQTSIPQADLGRESMSPISQTTRSNPTSLRSNSNGATPKHPPLSASRKVGKPSHRSASLGSVEDVAASSNSVKSAPVSDRYGKAPQQSSVKDMVKRFDPNSSKTKTGSTKPPPRSIITKDISSGGAGSSRNRSSHSSRTAGESSNTGGRSAVGSGPRGSGPAKSTLSSTKSTHKTRFAVDRQPSNASSNSSRETRTRRSSGSMAQASKSMTSLSPAAASPQSSLPQNRRPLFGEIVSTGEESQSIAYGIPRAAVRRTSDSNLHPPTWNRRRRQSDADVSPSSPTAWYLGATPTLDDIDPYRSRMKSAHNRAHSDFADSKVNTMNGVEQVIFPPPLTAPPPPPVLDDHDKTSTAPQSRIPVIATRLTNHSDASNPPSRPPSRPSSRISSRATSPYASRPGSSARLRKPDPSSRVPSGTTTHTTRGRSKAPEKLHSNNTSLKAYISAPPPKLSPPLRSSRPRQPVSSAVHSSSRNTDGATSSKETKSGMRLTRNASHSESKSSPRKLVTGPVDFAARRERIQRAYTKSIHESEQREIRAANLRRLNERRKNEAAAAATVEIAETPPMAKVEASPDLSDTVPAAASPNLHLSTSFHPASISSVSRSNPHAVTDDSPTLGIPGSFVADEDEAPPSAISTTATEFDNEPQTEAPQPSHVVAEANFPSRSSYQPSEPNDWTTDSLSSRKGYSGEYSGSIRILLDTSEITSPTVETTPTAAAFTRTSPSLPSAMNENIEGYHYKDVEDQPYNTLVPTTMPEPTTQELDSSELPDDSITPPTATTIPERYADGDVSANLTSLEDIHQSSHQNPFLQPDVPGMFPVSPEIDQYPSEIPDSVPGPRLELPMLRTALASSDVGSVRDQDYAGTPLTDMESDGLEALEDTGESRPEDSGSLYRDSGPYLAPRVYRPSQQSGWTNESAHTIEDSPSYQDYEYSVENTEYVDTSRRPTPPPKELPTPELSQQNTYSPQLSPHIPADAPIFNIPNFQQLPPLMTGEGLGLGFDTGAPEYNMEVTPLWPPDHSPPPIPQEEDEEEEVVVEETSPEYQIQKSPPPSIYNRRPPSSVYRASHDPESRRDSDDIYSPRGSISTPRSSIQISLEDVSAAQFVDTLTPQSVPETEEERKAAEKETKRLFKRRMLIKELLDTESVYLKDMNVVEEIYKGTAEACPKLDADDIRAIFRNTNEVIAFSTLFLDELKSASSSVYSSRSQRSRQSRLTTGTSATSSTEDRLSVAGTLAEETEEQKDRKTFIGATFGKHLTKMQEVYTNFLKNSEVASSRLSVLQEDGAVKVWLDECNLVAKDLTAAWSLDALLVKPVQRITRYQLLLHQIYECTPADHPDHEALKTSCDELGKLLKNIDDLKKRIHMVGKIVNRKRKESDVRSGFAKAFGRRAEKLQLSSSNRPPEDEAYLKLHEKFGDDYLRLQVVLRDVEYYTRQVTTYVNDFLRYLSAMELIMRMSASPYPEIESRWARFNMSMRDMGTVALEDHVNNVRRRVIKPFEQVIQAYGPPGLAMKKRGKRRLDYEKSLSLKAAGKKIDDKLKELVDQYEALNETLKFELPKLSQLTEKVGNMCLIQFVSLQTEWYSIWQDKVRVVLEDSQVPKSISDIVNTFNRDFKYVQARAQEFGIVNGTFLDTTTSARASQSTRDDESLRSKSRPSNLTTRPRGLSVTSDQSPSLPTPDFAKRLSGQFNFATIGLPPLSYQGQTPTSATHARTGSSSGSPAIPEPSPSRPSQASSIGRPGTGRSYTSDAGNPRISTDFNGQHRRESGSIYNSHYIDGPPHTASSRPFSGIFHSAMPLSDGPEDSSQRSSRASSHDRNVSGGYNVLYLAASLTYQAGEIFDVIGEKGELWLAKNQDDPTDQVGWIWSKHFARLAAD